MTMIIIIPMYLHNGYPTPNPLSRGSIFVPSENLPIKYSFFEEGHTYKYYNELIISAVE